MCAFQELSLYKEVFDKYANADGVIGVSEYGALLKDMGDKSDDEATAGALKQFEFDKDGLMTFEEFLKAPHSSQFFFRLSLSALTVV